MNTAFRDEVKAKLDAQCWDDGWYKCPKYRVKAKDSITHRAHTEAVTCWVCHKNDALAAEIAELLEVSK